MYIYYMSEKFSAVSLINIFVLPLSFLQTLVHFIFVLSLSFLQTLVHFTAEVVTQMEISSFPVLEDYSSLFSSLQDSDPSIISFSNPKKRPKFDNFENDSSVEDLLSKLLAFDSPQEEKQGHTPELPSIVMDSAGFSHQEKLDLDRYNRKRARCEVVVDDECGGQRRLWVKNRSKAWWELVNSGDYPEQEFKKAFRMSRETFDMICDELESVVTKKDTMLRLAIPVRQRVAVCIWRLATGESLREVSKRFGLGISTCHKLVLEVCTAIRAVLMPKFLQWPDDNRMRQIKTDFEFLSGIPNVGGLMYTTHVSIVAPKENVASYFNKRHTERNRKTCYSVGVQGVVDPNGVFTDISIGWPGSMTDDLILEKSALFKRANRGGVLKDTWIVGNSGYSLMDWVLVPYTHHNLTWTQHAYNQKIEQLQSVAKESFMRMKARWSCLQKRTEIKLQDLPIVVGACCVLHNICEMRNEGLSPELKFQLFDDEMIIPDHKSVGSVDALHVRDQIARTLLHHN